MKTLLAVLIVVVGLSAIDASSHSEAPNTASIPNADITDLYAFVSYEPGRSSYVTFLVNVYPLQSPYGGPNYYSLSTEHFYELYLDRNSDGTEDFSFQWIYGNSLPSSTPLGTPYLYQSDLQCQELYTYNTTPTQPSSPINLGIGLNISSAAQYQLVAVKVAGFILGSGGSLANLNWEEYYFLNLLTGPLQSATVTNLTSGGATRFDKPFDYAGQNSFGSPTTYENYALGYIYNVNLNGTMYCPSSGATGKSFVGQRQDPFYISLGRIFDFLNLIPVVLPQFSSLTIAECLTNNDLREKNVDTLALEIPIACLNASGGVVNIWAGVRNLYHAPGDFDGSSHIAGPQVSRLGNPLVNELVIGLIDKNRFSRQHPRLDADPNYGFASYVQYPTLPQVINLRYLAAVNSILGSSFTTLAPSVPRQDLVTVFLTGITGVNKGPGGFVGEVLRPNLSIQPIPLAQQDRHGIVGTILSGNFSDFAGFPNGRRPGDDIVDVSMMVVMGALCASAFTSNGFAFCGNGTAPIGGIYLTDGSPIQASNYKNAFPYFNTPTPGSYLESLPGNVVTDATQCYPAAQHGRCPICASGSTSSTPTVSPSKYPSGTSIPPASATPSPSAGTITCGSASGVGGFVLNLLKFF
jgi:hypothetical protein